MKKKSIGCKGFTLIELVLVIAILGVLTAISILSYSTLAIKSKESVDQNTARKIERCIFVYISTSNDRNLSQIGHSTASELVSNLQSETTITANSDNDKPGVYGPFLEQNITIKPQGNYSNWKITIKGSQPEIEVVPDNSNTCTITN